MKAEGCGVIRSEKISGGSRDGRVELATVLEFLRRFIKERQREGIERATGSGVYAGGKRRVDRCRIMTLSKAGNGAAATAVALGRSRMQVHRVLRES